MSTYTLHTGDALDILESMPDESVQCVVTSPPYWGLRDYGMDGQLGLETAPEEYTETMVNVFRQVKRVLREDGTLWVNLGDSYAAGGRGGGGEKQATNRGSLLGPKKAPKGLKPKDLVGIPWRLAFALQDDGWYLRSDIIWAKPNPMPESVRDRPSRAHEYIFLFSRSRKYYYDADAIRVPHKESSLNRVEYGLKQKHPDGVGVGMPPVTKDKMGERFCNPKGANRRTVWNIATQSFPGAHFATFPIEIPLTCIRAGTKHGDLVLDPFSGAGTTGVAACSLGREYIGIELNPEYNDMAERRLIEACRQDSFGYI